MLTLKNLSLTAADAQGRADIVKNVSLDVEDGKFLVITGPNGGGKTTLAKLIMGLATPTGGQIFLDGEDITGLSITDRAKRGISYSFQQPPRFKGMKVSDLLTIAAGKALSHDEACSYLTQVGLCARDYLNRDVDTSLSGGEAQRLKLASEIGRTQTDSVFVFDEPSIGLHPLDVRVLLGVFQALLDNGATVVVIEHDLDVIRNADYIIDMGPGGGDAGGEIVANGTPQEIQKNERSMTGKYL